MRVVSTRWYSLVLSISGGTLNSWYLQLVMEESIVPTTPESIDVASGSDPTQRHRQWLVRTIASRFEHWLAVHGKFRNFRETQDQFDTRKYQTHAFMHMLRGQMRMATWCASGANSQSNNSSANNETWDPYRCVLSEAACVISIDSNYQQRVFGRLCACGCCPKVV